MTTLDKTDLSAMGTVQAEAEPTGWFREDTHPAPENTVVWVPGGLAEKRNETWYSGEEVPRFQREIQWYVWCWHPLERLLPDPPKE